MRIQDSSIPPDESHQTAYGTPTSPVVQIFRGLAPPTRIGSRTLAQWLHMRSRATFLQDSSRVPTTKREVGYVTRTESGHCELQLLKIQKNSSGCYVTKPRHLPTMSVS